MDETPQYITYTDFSKVKQISQGNQTHTLTYGVDRERIKSVSKTANTTTKTKYYLGNYEEEHLPDGKIRKLHYIYTSSATAGVSGSDLKAIYVQNDGRDTLYYTHTDYQGNLIKVTDDKGKVVERYAYDPWGLRRNPTVWHEPDTRKSFLFDRGYTLHEHLDDFGLINMNGRVYDPLLAQFLSPDPYIQAPGNWLNYNRYTYGFNNPLMYTDPDGEWIHLVIGAVVGGVMNWATHGAEFTWEGLRYFGVGAAAGALGAGVGAGISSTLAGGSFGAGFVGSSTAMTATTSFISGAAIGGGAGFAGGFTTGFGNDLLQGGSFGHALGQGGIYGVIGLGSGALVGGLAGGIDAIRDSRNFWSGDDQGMGRSLFAFNNSDKAATHYRVRNGYRTIDGVEREGSQWVHAYDERVKYGTGDPNSISNGAISKRDNYLLPKDKDLNLSLNGFKGRANVNFSGYIPEGTSVQISFDGRVIATYGSGYNSGSFFIPSNISNVNVRYIVPTNYLRTGYISPWRTTITGFKRY
ncbi:MAG: hypothetical protein GX963_09705 [Bacteroidales bacterium]|nr:hypothetical protein [Bacteroidales bacterium]